MVETDLDVVIPIFNEIEIVEQLHTRVVAACRSTKLSYRIIYVDDGGSDGTGQWISRNAISGDQTTDRNLIPIQEENAPSEYVSLVELSRNFGQPAAIHAGLQQSRGRCVVLMDGDLQDPPELIPEMVARWLDGDQVVIAQRTGRKETFVRGLAFKAFHTLFRYLSDSNIPSNTGTFCLLDRVAADSICSLSESHRFFPGLRAWVGYRQSMLTFKRPPRAGGEPKQTFFRLVKYALDAVFGYSFKPLRLLTTAGILVCSLSLCFGLWLVFKRIAGWETASIGFTTLACAVFGLGGFQLIGLGILGEYIGRIYDEVKARPQFIVSNQEHFTRSTKEQASGAKAHHSVNQSQRAAG